MMILVTYDVATVEKAGQRRLRRVAQACEDYGTRVQKSVFECQVGQKEWVLFRDRLLLEMKADEDSLRFYYLDEKAVVRTEHHGIDKPVNLSEPLILRSPPREPLVPASFPYFRGLRSEQSGPHGLLFFDILLEPNDATLASFAETCHQTPVVQPLAWATVAPEFAPGRGLKHVFSLASGVGRSVAPEFAPGRGLKPGDCITSYYAFGSPRSSLRGAD